MPSFQTRRNDDGSTSTTALVRVRGFKPVSKTFRDAREAEAWAEKTESDLRALKKRGAARPDVVRVTIADLCEAFLADPKTNAMRSRSSLELLLLWWTENYGGERAMTFGTVKLREARQRLLDGRSNSTANRYLSALRSAWNWGRHSGVVPADQAWPSRMMLPEPRGRTRFLDDKELDRLFKSMKREPSWFKAAVVVSIATGVRQGELLRLRWKDLDLKRNALTVLEAKNGEARSVHLPSSAIEAVEALGKKREPMEQVFPVSKSALVQRWNDLRDRAKLEDFNWHDLRHTCASFLAQSGANLLEIGSVLGHRSPSVTQRYSHLVAGAALTAHAGLDRKLKR